MTDGPKCNNSQSDAHKFAKMITFHNIYLKCTTNLKSEMVCYNSQSRISKTGSSRNGQMLPISLPLGQG